MTLDTINGVVQVVWDELVTTYRGWSFDVGWMRCNVDMLNLVTCLEHTLVHG